MYRLVNILNDRQYPSDNFRKWKPKIHNKFFFAFSGRVTDDPSLAPAYGYAPAFDHTTGTPYGHYLYFYDSSSDAESATMLSEVFAIEKDSCFSFWVHMYGDKVRVSSRGQCTDIMKYFHCLVWNITLVLWENIEIFSVRWGSFRWSPLNQREPLCWRNSRAPLVFTGTSYKSVHHCFLLLIFFSELFIEIWQNKICIFPCCIMHMMWKLPVTIQANLHREEKWCQ